MSLRLLLAISISLTLTPVLALCADRSRVQHRFARGLFVLGIATLAYIFGAAAMYFGLPTSHFLGQAFNGGRAWFERKQADPALPPTFKLPLATVTLNKPGTFDGFTLYSTGQGTEAVLINMQGDVVHRWSISFSKIWPNPSADHIRAPIDDSRIHIFNSYLFPNGDLLAVLEGMGDTPYGYGLVKLDRESNVVWAYAANCHHSVDVDEDGTIYVLTHKIVKEMPDGLGAIPTPTLVDYVVLLDAKTGVELQKISLLEAFHNGPYANLLGPVKKLETPPAGAAVAWNEQSRGDVLHTNSVHVLSRELAKSFPMFEAGQVLISVRNLDTVAVLDTVRQQIVWAKSGPWKSQHDPRFLANGHLLIFDNLGPGANMSRVLEYHPATQAIPWSTAEDPQVSFYSPVRGNCQRLPNGNTFIVNANDGQLLEISSEKKVIWDCSCYTSVASARRYGPDQLSFLNQPHEVPRP